MTLPTAAPQPSMRSGRHCTYCPAPGADACVRTQGDGETHIYAHQACAQAKGVDTLYVFTDEQPAGGSS